MTEIEIEKEVQTRVEFKMNELLTGVRNQAKVNWHCAFATMQPKYQHYWEAFEQMAKMWKKELDMATPSNDMYEEKVRHIKNTATEDLMHYVDPKRMMHPRERMRVQGCVAKIVEHATQCAIN